MSLDAIEAARDDYGNAKASLDEFAKIVKKKSAPNKSEPAAYNERETNFATAVELKISSKLQSIVEPLAQLEAITEKMVATPYSDSTEWMVRIYQKQKVGNDDDLISEFPIDVELTITGEAK